MTKFYGCVVRIACQGKTYLDSMTNCVKLEIFLFLRETQCAKCSWFMIWYLVRPASHLKVIKFKVEFVSKSQKLKKYIESYSSEACRNMQKIRWVLCNEKRNVKRHRLKLLSLKHKRTTQKASNFAFCVVRDRESSIIWDLWCPPHVSTKISCVLRCALHCVWPKLHQTYWTSH